VDRLVSLAAFLDVPVSRFIGEHGSAKSSSQSLIDQFDGKETRGGN